jgi:hypothetical protein
LVRAAIAHLEAVCGRWEKIWFCQINRSLPELAGGVIHTPPMSRGGLRIELDQTGLKLFLDLLDTI